MTEFELRAWQAGDLPALVKFLNNSAITDNMTDGFFPFPYTEDMGKRFLSFAMNPAPATIFAIDVEGQAVGSIGIHPQQDIMKKNAELGYWLAEPYWGRGIISAAVKEMVKFAFTEYDISRLFARPFGRNIASQRVLEKCGFRLEAKLEATIFKNGRFENELIYAVRQ